MTIKKNRKIAYPASEKLYVPGTINKVLVGMRRINLTDTETVDAEGVRHIKKNNPVVLYDTSGPYSDPLIETDDSSGIPRIREEWCSRRKDIRLCDPAASSDFTTYKAKEGKAITQLYYAKKRIVTPEMEYVAIRENQQVEALGLKSYITPDFVRKEVAAGRAVIPANINHPEAEPMIIGRKFRVKVNTNLQDLFSFKNKEEGIGQMILNCKWGSDTFMCPFQAEDIAGTHHTLLRYSPIPVGSVPLFQALDKAGGSVEELNWEIYRDTLIEQAEQGIDFFVIHAAMLRSYIDMTFPRLTGIASRAGAIIARWVKIQNQENFLYTHFDEICELLRAYDVTLVIGDGLRSGSIYDANDRAQFAELHTKGQLTRIAWEHFVQVMIEGPGFLPINKISENIKEQQYACQHAPYFTYGPITTDIGHGYDHITSVIGATQMAWQGAALIGGVIPREFIAGPNKEDYRNSIISYKLAAHAADIAKGHPGAQARDNALCKAFVEKRRKDEINLSIDPERVNQSLKNGIRENQWYL
ncbi:phosphomethylpyrimidine synthase ThiC [Parabacteroides sp. PF5-6]|uniref:phosphomethylpyrimidine synthase ThiC n=1 Tax=Parabacteroides sp. PF5-6 TaxID=1742403 RepID=UPI002404A741|nr:phosphomethylpyrimidine synthase ThiC [Parabacteroides sp. PF5-6]MDF9829619.1 phosphomethylpyrimidine synthase [Parabacteroides sp. PF5-6]